MASQPILSLTALYHFPSCLLEFSANHNDAFPTKHITSFFSPPPPRLLFCRYCFTSLACSVLSKSAIFAQVVKSFSTGLQMNAHTGGLSMVISFRQTAGSIKISPDKTEIYPHALSLWSFQKGLFQHTCLDTILILFVRSGTAQ